MLGLTTAKFSDRELPVEMATDPKRRAGREVPDDPDDLLPEDSVLTLEEYLDMHAAVGNRTRYEVLYRLVHGGELSPTELVDALDIDDSTLHYHLNKLVETGLVEKRQQTDRGQDGLYTYYRATVFGEVTLTEGVDELIRGERAFDEMYDSSVDVT
jgi:DNA-binding transcriptional ArsR family regulator